MARRFIFLSKKRKGQGMASGDLMSLAEEGGVGKRAQEIEKETASGEDIEKRFSGGRIRDLFDALDIDQAQLIGGIKRLLGKDVSPKEAYEKRQSFMDLLPATMAGKLAGLAGDVVLDPKNLLSVGLFSKVDDIGDIARVVSKAGDIAQGTKTTKTAVEALSKTRKASWAQNILEQGNVVARGTKITLGELALSGIKQAGQKMGKSIDVGGLGKIPGIRKVKDVLGEKFVYQYQIPEEGGRLLDEADLARRLGLKQGADIGEHLGKVEKRLGSKLLQRRSIGARTIGERKPLIQLGKELSPKDFSSVKDAYRELDNAGRELMANLPDNMPNKAKIALKNTYEQHIGSYVRNYYQAHELGKGARVLGSGTKPLRAKGDMLKGIQDIPEEIVQSLKPIQEGGYAIGKSIGQIRETTANFKLFKGISRKFAKDVAEEGFERLPKVATLGDLSGKAIPKPFYNYINEIVRPRTPTEKWLSAFVRGFKYGKVILNPATHARNIMSNFILNSFEGMNFSNPKTWEAYAGAGKEMLKPGKYTELFTKLGGGLETFRSTELASIAIGEAKIGSKGMRAGKKFLEKAGDMYQNEEKFAKMAQFIFQINRGVSPKEAIKAAEAATFNYAQITPFIRKVRQSVFGAPFITFSYKATPQVAKTLIKHPAKIALIGKLGRGAERFSPQEELAAEKAVEPDYMKENFFVKLAGKDKFDRSGYFDLSYIIPFGDLVSGDVLDNPLQALPLWNFIKEIHTNKSFTGQPIYKESGTPFQIASGIGKHLAKAYLPTPLGITGVPGLIEEKSSDEDFNKRIWKGSLPKSIAFEQSMGDETATGSMQTRDIGQEIARNLGLKIQPFNLEYQKERKQRDKMEALKQLLKDEGVTQELNIPYKPKKKKFNFL